MIDKEDNCRINFDRIRACIMDRTDASENINGKKLNFKEEYPISEDDETRVFRTSITLDKSKECAYIDVQVCEIEERAFFENVAVVCAKLTKTISPCCFWFSDNETYIRAAIDFQNEIINNEKIDRTIIFLSDGIKNSYTVVRKTAHGKMLTVDEVFNLDNINDNEEEILEEIISEIKEKHISSISNNEEDKKAIDTEDDDDTDKDENGNFILPSSIFRRNSFEDEDEGLSILDRINKRMKESKHDELFDRLAAEKENQEE